MLVQLQLRDLRLGTKRHDRRRSYDMVEVAKMEHRSLQYLYSEGDSLTCPPRHPRLMAKRSPRSLGCCEHHCCFTSSATHSWQGASDAGCDSGSLAPDTGQCLLVQFSHLRLHLYPFRRPFPDEIKIKGSVACILQR